MNGRKIHLCVNDRNNKTIAFKAVEKEIAFKNMAFIDYNSKDKNSNIPEIIESNIGNN